MQDKLKISDKDGNEKEYDILFSFESTNTNKFYIVYTDYAKDENDVISCYSGIYDNGLVLPVNTEAENNIIEKMVKTISDKAKINYGLKTNEE